MSELPKVSATNPEESSNGRVRAPRDWLYWALLVSTVVVGVAVVTFALLAARRLGSAGKDSDWIPVYQEILKISFGALAVGALGGLAKLIFDQRKARAAAADELRDRRYRFISELVAVGHDVDTAKLVIRANRSVKSWTAMVNDRIIPAHSRLRDLTHQLDNWDKAGLPVFVDIKSDAQELTHIDAYLTSLLDEYGKEKQALGELQLKAKEAKQTSQQNREQFLARIWNVMRQLQVLGGLISHEHDDSYNAYRSNYVGALLKMRRELRTRVSEKAAQSPAAASSARSFTTPEDSSSPPLER